MCGVVVCLRRIIPPASAPRVLRVFTQCLITVARAWPDRWSQFVYRDFFFLKRRVGWDAVAPFDFGFCD